MKNSSFTPKTVLRFLFFAFVLLCAVPVHAASLFVLDNTNVDVRQFSGTTGNFTGVFGQTGGNLTDPVALAFHPGTGNLFVADNSNKVVREFDANTGNLIGDFGETGANLSNPVDMRFHPSTGNLFVADSVNGDVREFNGTTGAFVGSFGQTAANLSTPTGLVFHPSTGNLLVSDSINRDVRQFNGSTGSFTGTFGQTGSNLTNPTGLAFHPTTGNLFVSDILIFGGGVQEFDGTSGSFTGTFGQTSNNLLSPQSLDFNPDTGNLVVADTAASTDRVREFNGTSGNFIGGFGQTGINVSNPVALRFQPTLGTLSITPATAFSSTGDAGGPFSPASQTYTLTNSGQQTINYTVSKTQTWVTLTDNGTGTLAGGASTTVDVAINSSANSLAPGPFSDTVTFTNTTNNLGSATRAVNLTVSVASTLMVSPNEIFDPVGFQGGPFNPLRKTYTLSNPGTQSFTYTVSKTQTWLTLTDKGGGTLAAGASTNVIAAINTAAANALAPGTYRDAISFTNTTDGKGSTGRPVELRVVALPTVSNPSSVVAPYWQTDTGSYTFMAVSHPSLVNMSPQIGVVMTAINRDDTPFAPAAEFTLQSGSTQKVFITGTNHASINSTTLPGAVFITGTSAGANGHIFLRGAGLNVMAGLNLWGAVIIQATTTGFAMEFIGDGQDSRAFNTPLSSGLN